MADGLPRCSVVIPTYNGADLTAACLDELLAHPPTTCEWSIIVVDDASPEDPEPVLAGYERDITFVRLERNRAFAGACNAGARAAGETDYLVFLNNDTLPTPGWLDVLIEEMERDAQLAAVGSKLIFPNGQIQHAGLAIHQNGLPFHLYMGFDSAHPAVNYDRDVVGVTGACLLVRSEDFDALGGFDESYVNAFEDVDLCLRLGERGRRIRYCHRSVVVHLESVTRFPDGTPVGVSVSERLYDEHWRDRVVPDDLLHYGRDGLITTTLDICPVEVSVAPELGFIHRDESQFGEMEHVTAVRARQILRLLSAENRREIAARRSTPRPLLRAAPAREPVLLHAGSDHELGGGGPRLISVLIPVKNGGPQLGELLEGIVAQSLSTRLEIVAIDSGSQDDSLAVLSRFGARTYGIRPMDFDHGVTRNQLAEQARGEILVFVNQGARPADDGWLAPLIAALDGDPQVAGACSRVVARPGADPLTARDVARDLSGSDAPRRIEITDWGHYERMDAVRRRAFLNFHTVSTAIRADAMQRTPFRSVRTLGEDLLWAREVVEGGWTLVHQPDSRVQHTHDYSFDELLGRNVDDGVANRDVVERVLDSELVEPTIRNQVADDWAFLREELGLTGDELERHQVDAVLRRTSQVVGQWLGSHYDTLPEGLTARFSNVARVRACTPEAEDG
jgi:GT2 family glycosyltransferase